MASWLCMVITGLMNDHLPKMFGHIDRKHPVLTRRKTGCAHLLGSGDWFSGSAMTAFVGPAHSIVLGIGNVLGPSCNQVPGMASCQDQGRARALSLTVRHCQVLGCAANPPQTPLKLECKGSRTNGLYWMCTRTLGMAPSDRSYPHL